MDNFTKALYIKDPRERIEEFKNLLENSTVSFGYSNFSIEVINNFIIYGISNGIIYQVYVLSDNIYCRHTLKYIEDMVVKSPYYFNYNFIVLSLITPDEVVFPINIPSTYFLDEKINLLIYV